jgi:hypothetical protein
MSVLRRVLGTRTAFTITLASLANVAGRVSTQIDLTDAAGLAPQGLLVQLKIKTATAPTAGTTIQVYWARGEDGTGFVDGSLAATDTGYTSGSSPFTAAQIRDQLQFVGSIPVQVTGSLTYQSTFIITDPGPRGSLYIFNDCGQALSSTGGDHSAHYQTLNTDISAS